MRTFFCRLLRYCCHFGWSLLYAMSNLAHADAVNVDVAGTAPLNLTPYWEVLEDPQRRLRIEDVVAGAGRFQNPHQHTDSLNFGMRRSAMWLRITLRNPGSKESERWLEVAYSQLHDVEFYVPAEGRFQRHETGISKPFAQRPLPHRNFVFPLRVPAEAEATFYLRIATATTFEVPTTLWMPFEFRLHALHEYMGQALYFGMLLALGLYNLLLYFSLRDRAYFYYVMFMLASALSLIGYSGLGYQYLWPEAPAWTKIAPMVGFAASGLTLILFQRRLLSTVQTVPILDRVLRVFVAINVAQILGFLLLPFERMIGPGIAIDATNMLLVLTVAIACKRRRQRSAGIFLLAFSCLVGAALLTALRAFGLAVPNVISAYGMQIGSALEMLLLSLALADRFHQLRQEKEAAQQALVENLQRSERELEQKVEARTHELSEKNTELEDALTALRQAQKQLVEAEKMASLGGLVAGVAHEINTPVGIGVTAASSLADSTGELMALYQSGDMKKSDLEHFMQTSDATSKLILNNLERAAALIRSFKQIAVDRSSEERRHFNLKTYLAEVLRNLEPQLREANLACEIDCPGDIEIDSYPGALSQILINLTANAIAHGYDDGQSGALRISVAREGEKLKLMFADDGKGIAPEHLGKIYDPFFTTKRSSGRTGLGLHIVYNLVRNSLDGSIDCVSAPDKGTAFAIRL